MMNRGIERRSSFKSLAIFCNCWRSCLQTNKQQATTARTAVFAGKLTAFRSRGCHNTIQSFLGGDFNRLGDRFALNPGAQNCSSADLRWDRYSTGKLVRSCHSRIYAGCQRSCTRSASEAFIYRHRAVEITAQLARKGTGKALAALDVGLVWRTVFRYDQTRGIAPHSRN
jgi:hypothetical protein